MAGVADKPFREVCRKMGAGLTTSEMAIIKDNLLGSFKSKTRLDFSNESPPISVQIAGSSVEDFVYSAKFVAKNGANIIDLNMGCPAKKVCHKLAGSALLKDEKLVANILKEVVNAVDIPITLKIRTGWDRANRNAVNIAKIAENEGIKMLVVHGRTREDKYLGEAEYDTIAEVVQSINIPVIANGDITTLNKAKMVLEKTQAQGLMLGRGTQGKPWFIKELICFLQDSYYQETKLEEKITIIKSHIKEIYDFYGDIMGVRLARKHIFWYSITLFKDIDEDYLSFWQKINKLSTQKEQYQCLETFLNSYETMYNK
ncbi:tRNA dihydrouridine synthase B [hydrothermal vent metagenome]|uniref:tRNA dihydrouridine synthase B n=1 Tax=hydrothermal vent metagenome TaxID=652676 RepID=A0A1W1BIP7_9ZZZZ